MLGEKHIFIGVVIAAIFFSGIIIGVSIKKAEAPDVNMPSEIEKNGINGLAEKPLTIESIAPQKRDSPSDRIRENNIKIDSRRVTIDVENALLARFTDTKSMEPVLNKDSNAIEIIPRDADDIQIGDIISFKSDFSDGIIIHRVIEKDIDEQGAYFRTKGDNLEYTDPEKLRFGQIQRVVVGILY